eukprot:387674-Amphidinium_carterae.1
MAFFPTETAAADLSDLGDVRDWVGLNDHAFNAFESVVGDLGNSLRNLALLQRNHIRMAVEAARVQIRDGDPRSLSVVETSQVGLVWRIAKKKTLQSGGTAWTETEVEDPLIIPEKRELPLEEPGTDSNVGQAQKKLKMSNIIDQTDDSELTSGK